MKTPFDLGGALLLFLQVYNLERNDIMVNNISFGGNSGNSAIVENLTFGRTDLIANTSSRITVAGSSGYIWNVNFNLQSIYLTLAFVIRFSNSDSKLARLSLSFGNISYTLFTRTQETSRTAYISMPLANIYVQESNTIYEYLLENGMEFSFTKSGTDPLGSIQIPLRIGSDSTPYTTDASLKVYGIS